MCHMQEKKQNGHILYPKMGHMLIIYMSGANLYNKVGLVLLEMLIIGWEHKKTG